MKILALILILGCAAALPQENKYEFDLFTVNVDLNTVTAEDDNNIFYRREFHNMKVFTEDLDGDSVEEFIVLDSLSEGRPSYTMYIYNTIDSFYAADSIFSGFFEPYTGVSEDLEGTVIIAGSGIFIPEFNTTTYIPINIWKYEGSELFSVNEEVYDLFMEKAEEITGWLDERLKKDKCSAARRYKGEVAAGYVNYLNAGEESLAAQFLKNYYPCDDAEVFKNRIDELLNTGDE